MTEINEVSKFFSISSQESRTKNIRNKLFSYKNIQVKFSFISKIPMYNMEGGRVGKVTGINEVSKFFSISS